MNKYAILTKISEIIKNYKNDTNIDDNNEITKGKQFKDIINIINELTKTKNM